MVVEMELHLSHIIQIKLKILLPFLVLRNFKNNFNKGTKDNNNKNSKSNSWGKTKKCKDNLWDYLKISFKIKKIKMKEIKILISNIKKINKNKIFKKWRDNMKKKEEQNKKDKIF